MKRFGFTSRTASQMLVVFAGILFYLSLSRLDACFSLLRRFGHILSPLLIGLAIAYVLDPVVCFCERRMSRRPAVALTCLGAVCITIGLFRIVGPQLFKSARSLLNSVPFYFSQLKILLDLLQTQYGFDVQPILNFMDSYLQLLSRALNFAVNNLPTLIRYGMALGNGLIQFFTGAVFSVYVLLDKQKLLRQCRRVIFALLPRRWALRLFHVCNTANRMLHGFVGGKLEDSAIVWLLCTVLSLIAGIPYAVLFSLIVGITNIIPIFGPILGGAVSVLILLVLSPVKALIFAVLILILQQLDGKIIGPHILGRSTGLKTLWVLIAILVGGRVAGVPGMILGVPVFATCYTLGKELLDLRLAARGINDQGEPVTEAAAPSADPELYEQLSFFAGETALPETPVYEVPEEEALEVEIPLNYDTLDDLPPEPSADEPPAQTPPLQRAEALMRAFRRLSGEEPIWPPHSGLPWPERFRRKK